MSVLNSQFVKGICCQHRWQLVKESNYRCSECRATCLRDESGQIVEYDLTAGFELDRYQGQREKVQAAFDASPEEMGRAAVAAARPRTRRNDTRRS